MTNCCNSCDDWSIVRLQGIAVITIYHLHTDTQPKKKSIVNGKIYIFLPNKAISIFNIVYYNIDLPYLPQPLTLFIILLSISPAYQLILVIYFWVCTLLSHHLGSAVIYLAVLTILLWEAVWNHK